VEGANKLSEQIAQLQQQLTQKNSQIENLQKDVAEARSEGTAQTSASNKQLRDAQAQVQALKKQLDELKAQQAAAATAAPAGGGKTGAAAGGLASGAGRSAAGGSDRSGGEVAEAPAKTGGLAPGGTAWVTRAGGLPLRLRSGPSLEGKILDRLQPGTRLTLIEGPRQADGHAWWHIRTDDDRVGWVAGEELRTQPD
jgi:hypothetical protein